MEEADVAHSIIIDVCGIYGEDYREGNDHAAEAVREHPDKLTGFAYLHPPYAGIEACLAEADRCIRKLGFRGLKIHPVTDYHPINSPEFVYPLVEKAVEHDVPFFVHTGHPPMSGPILMADLARDFPGYGWDHNAGYGTAEHLAALARLGVTPHHRRGFAPVRAVLERGLV